ncbi:CaiB/BaiF CoA transferase family protein [Vineibacter terrae]|nr:CoA transferase [Vineibacter terrae]
METEQMPPPCLSDVRVIDLSHVIAGPAASMYLAALGAEVLKVENPRAPDVMRFVEGGPEGAMSSTFATLNAGKKSLAIDLKNPRLRDVLFGLLRDADVLIENFRPGVAERLGIGYEAVRAINPRIIYLSISGYGQAGAWSRFGAYDQVVQALTGMMMANGEEDGPPTKVGFPVVDIATGMLGAMSVLAALHRRAATDAGSRIDTSLAQGALQLMRPMAVRVLATEQDGPRPGNRGFSGSPGAATFRCAGGWLAVAANTRRQFGVLCDLLGLPGVADDPALVRQVGDGGATNVLPVDAAELRRRLEGAFARHDAAALELRLNAAGVPAARVRRMGEFLHEARHGLHVDPGLQRLQGDAGAFLQLGPGVAGLGVAGATPAPMLGAGTADILRRAGLSPEEIGALAQDGAIRVSG